MFEKEAEKWTIDYVCKDCSRYKKCKSKEHCTCKDCSKEKWQNGAEFGYNKANEWHFVKDGDLPEVDNRIVLCVCVDGYIDEKKHYILKLLTRKEFPLFQPVYAWKEIVLPKENE